MVSRALAFGMPDVPRLLAMWVLRLADRLILQRYVPLAVVGLYSVGYTLGGTLFDLVAAAVNSALLPFFYRTASEEPAEVSRRVFADVAGYNAALLAFLALGSILFAREFILVFASERYLGAEAVVAPIAWASVFQALSHIPNRALYLARKTAYLPLVFVVPAALNITLNFLLIPPYGMWGAALATLAAYPALFLLSLWAAQRVYPIPYDFARMARPLLIAAALSAAGTVASGRSLPAALAMKALLLAAFPVALAASGFLSARERQAVRQMAVRALAGRAKPSMDANP